MEFFELTLFLLVSCSIFDYHSGTTILKRKRSTIEWVPIIERRDHDDGTEMAAIAFQKATKSATTEQNVERIVDMLNRSLELTQRELVIGGEKLEHLVARKSQSNSSGTLNCLFGYSVLFTIFIDLFNYLITNH